MISYLVVICKTKQQPDDTQGHFSHFNIITFKLNSFMEVQEEGTGVEEEFVQREGQGPFMFKFLGQGPYFALCTLHFGQLLPSCTNCDLHFLKTSKLFLVSINIYFSFFSIHSFFYNKKRQLPFVIY